MPRNFLIVLSMMAGVGVAAFAALWAFSPFSKPTPEEKLAALKKEVQPKGGEIFQTVLLGKPVTFLLLECSVYIVDTSGDSIQRNIVLTTGFYFGLDSCTNQSIAVEGEFVQVYLANRAIGAGGGNTSGGNYRSKDGVRWEKQTGRKWHAVDGA